MAGSEIAKVETRVLVKGTPDHVAAVLRTAAARGVLLSDPSQLQPVRIGDDAAVWVKMLMPVRPKRQKPAMPRRGTVAGDLLRAGVFAGLIVLAVLGFIWAAMALIGAIASRGLAALTSVTGGMGGVVALAAVILVLYLLLPIAHPGKCPCPNCKH